MDRKPKIMDAVLELVGGQMSGETENFSSKNHSDGSYCALGIRKGIRLSAPGIPGLVSHTLFAHHLLPHL